MKKILLINSNAFQPMRKLTFNCISQKETYTHIPRKNLPIPVPMNRKHLTSY